MGEVFLARDKKLDRQVAIKFLNETFSREESLLNRFIQEAKAALRERMRSRLTFDETLSIMIQTCRGNCGTP